MKKIYFLSSILLFCMHSGHAQSTVEIDAVGLTFSPDNVNINAGDTIFFNVGSSHPVLQTSETTWNVNGSVPLEGGFSFLSGVGKIAFNIPGVYYYICTNHISSGMKGKINVNQVTNIIETGDTKEELKIFPNPVTGSDLHLIFYAENTGYYTIKITDITGKTYIIHNIYYYSGHNNKLLDISKLTNGIYFLELEGEGVNLYSRFIK